MYWTVFGPNIPYQLVQAIVQGEAIALKEDACATAPNGVGLIAREDFVQTVGF